MFVYRKGFGVLKQAALVAALAVLVGCGTQPMPDPQPAAKETSRPEDAIREAVYRYQMQHNASGLQGAAKVFFLATSTPSAISYTDPDDAFMRRFANTTPPVKKASASMAQPETSLIVDKQTGDVGLILSITSVKMLDAHTAEVEGGYYEANLSASGNTYRVERKGDQWVVSGDVMHWIS